MASDPLHCTGSIHQIKDSVSVYETDAPLKFLAMGPESFVWCPWRQANAMREFELLGTGEDRPNPLLLERLRACGAVIDALGYKARDELIDTLCKKELGVYTAIFSATGDTAVRPVAQGLCQGPQLESAAHS